MLLCNIYFHLQLNQIYWVMSSGLGKIVMVSLVRFVIILVKWGTQHYTDVTMGAMASQITSLVIVYSTVYSGSDQRKHHSSASLTFVWGIHPAPVNSLHKWPVTWKMFLFDDVIMKRNSNIPWPVNWWKWKAVDTILPLPDYVLWT